MSIKHIYLFVRVARQQNMRFLTTRERFNNLLDSVRGAVRTAILSVPESDHNTVDTNITLVMSQKGSIGQFTAHDEGDISVNGIVIRLWHGEDGKAGSQYR